MSQEVFKCWMMNEFNHYLIEYRCKLIQDHTSLEWLFECQQGYYIWCICQMAWRKSKQKVYYAHHTCAFLICTWIKRHPILYPIGLVGFASNNLVTFWYNATLVCKRFQFQIPKLVSFILFLGTFFVHRVIGGPMLLIMDLRQNVFDYKRHVLFGFIIILHWFWFCFILVVVFDSCLRKRFD